MYSDSKRTFAGILVVLSLCFLMPAQAENVVSIDKANLDRNVARVAKAFGIPGIALSIVQDNAVYYSSGYGFNSLDNSESVSEETLFAIGSISKSFTALALGLLVDEGKLDWNDAVIKHLPTFRLYDPYVTAHFTNRDLLTHRSGLKQVSGGTFYYGSDYSREEIVHRLRHLKPVSEFRTVSAYQNVMFIVAGEIIKSVAGQSWDTFLKKRIFDPLGMNRTVSKYADITSSNNLAEPHTRDTDWNKIQIPHRNHDNIGPAGSIYSTAKDMSQYMRLILNRGEVDGKRLVSDEVIAEILKPQVHYPVYQAPAHNAFTSYGFGWWLTPRAGHTIIEHSGGVDGMIADLKLVAELKSGVIVLSNADKESGVFVLSNDILEQLIGDKVSGRFERLSKVRQSNFDLMKSDRLAKASSQIQETSPSLNLDDYAGTYIDNMYGEVYIKLRNSQLEMQFSHTPAFTGELKHWHYDTFEIDWIDPMIPNGFVSFVLNAQGKVTELRIDQPDLLDVDFTELELLRKN